MSDLKRLFRSDVPKLNDLLVVHEAYEILKRLSIQSNGGPVTLASVASRLSEPCSPQSLYRTVARVERTLGRGEKLFETRRGTGTTIVDSECHEDIRKLLAAYDKLTRPKLNQVPAKLTIGTTQILSVRILPRPEKRFRETSGSQAMLVENICTDPQVLLDNEQLEENSIIFTSCDKRSPPRKSLEFIDKYELHPCLLCPTGHKFSKGFVWPELVHETTILPRDEHAAPSYPWKKVEAHAGKVLRVGTTIEGHSLVLAGHGVFPTHREFLTQQEEKYLEVVSLGDLPTTTIALLAKKRPVRSKQEQVAIETLRREIESQFDHLTAKHKLSCQLSTVVREFRTFWAIRQVAPPGKQRQRPFWVPAEVQLEVTPSGYVRGTYQVQRRSGAPRAPSESIDRNASQGYEVFGRSRQRGCMTHLICRATYVDSLFDDHGDAQFLYPTDEFTENTKFIVGAWYGRESSRKEDGVGDGLGHGLGVCLRTAGV